MLYSFKPEDPKIGLFSVETFDSMQDYFDRDAYYDSVQRSIGLKSPKGLSFYFNSLNEFSGSPETLPDLYYQVNGLDEIIEPKGLEGRIEWALKDRNYLNYTGYLFWGGIGESKETTQYRKKFIASWDRPTDVFQDKEAREIYQTDDVFLQFILSIPDSVKRGEYGVSLLGMNLDPFAYSDKTPVLLSYKVNRKNKVDTYIIRVKRGGLVFETRFNKTEGIPGDSAMYRIALRQNGQVEIWAADLYIRSIKGDFFDVFQPVGPSDPEFVEPTEGMIHESKKALLDIPGGIGFYGQSFELENSENRVSFSFLHLSNSMAEVHAVQNEFTRNQEFYHKVILHDPRRISEGEGLKQQKEDL